MDITDKEREENPVPKTGATEWPAIDIDSLPSWETKVLSGVVRSGMLIDPETGEVLMDETAFKDSEGRVRDFKEWFSRENPYVRQCLVRDLGSLNQILEMGLGYQDSFAELAIKDYADSQGIPFFDMKDPPGMPCPDCGSTKTKLRADKLKEGSKLYRCRCGKNFAPGMNSIVSDGRKDLTTYAKFIQAVLNYETVARTCDICEIEINTYYRMLLNVYQAMWVMLNENLKLYGNLQADECYVRMSYKGAKFVEVNDYDPEDDRFIKDLPDREKKARGGPVKKSERYKDMLAVLVACDDHGHCRSWYASVGVPGFKSLCRNIPKEAFLNEVPEKDPFQFKKKTTSEPKTTVGNQSTFVCDGERTLVKYGEEVLGMKVFSRVYRRNGKQTKTPKKYRHLNIQRVNYYHARLREHLYRCGSGNSRLLRGALIHFDFRTNTGAPYNRAAVDELLRILSRPNLYDPEFERKFVFPDAFVSWLEDKSRLKKTRFEVCYAFFLMYKQRHPDEFPTETIPTTELIQQLTGLSVANMNRSYLRLSELGYTESIVRLFGKYDPLRDKIVKVRSLAERASKVDDAVLVIYDRYAKIRPLPYPERVPLQTICDEVNAEFNTTYSTSSVTRYFDIIQETGLRPPLPALKTNEMTVNSYIVPYTAFDVLDDYYSIVADSLDAELAVPRHRDVIDKLGKMYPDLTVRTISNYVSLARRYRHEAVEPQSESVFEGIYDAYMEFLKDNEFRPQSGLEERFFADARERAGLSLPPERIRERILGLAQNRDKRPMAGTRRINDSMIKILDDYLYVVDLYCERGVAVPAPGRMLDILWEMNPAFTRGTIKEYLQMIKKARGVSTVTPIDSVLAFIYADYSAFREAHYYDQEDEARFFAEMRQKYEVSFELDTIKNKLRKYGKQEGVPPLAKYKTNVLGKAYGKNISENALKAMEIYNRIARDEFLEKELTVPSDKVMIARIQDELPLSTNSLRLYLSQARKYMKEQEKGDSGLPGSEKTEPTSRALQVLEVYERIAREEYLDKGLPVPSHKIMHKHVQEEIPVAFATYQNYLSQAKKLREADLTDSDCAEVSKKRISSKALEVYEIYK